MRIKRRNSNNERRILIGMIVDKKILTRIASKWKDNIFRSKHANLIAQWCIRYYERYEDAPKAAIEPLFESWSERTKDEASSKAIHKLLSSISDEYENLSEESNSDYIIDMAGKHFNQVQLERVVEKAEEELDHNEPETAHSILTGYNKIEMGLGEGIDLLQEKDKIKEAFDEKQEDLIKYPGALGEFFQEIFVRDGFVAFAGPAKRGKSMWLMDVAYRSISQRKKVAFFEVGDMSQNQIIRRFMIRISRHPRWAQTIEYPVKIKHSKRKGCQIKTKEKIFNKKLNWKYAKQQCNQLMKRKIKSKRTFLKLSCHANSSLHINQLESILDEWEIEDWIPDVVVIDYADILNMEFRDIEGRDRINETWKKLRRLSQARHCLVVTATQSDTLSYDKKIISMANFSDDRRKNDHVTAMIGINQTDKEKRLGVMRLNLTAAREKEFYQQKCVHVAGCLALGNPAMKACF